MKPVNIRKRNVIIICASALFVGIVLLAIAYPVFFGKITDKNAVIYIPENTPFEVLMDSVSAGGKITKPARLLKAARIVNLKDNVNPGRYEITPNTSAIEIARRISLGRQSPMRVTFNNIRTLDQLAITLGKTLMADSAAFAELFHNDSLAGSYGFTEAEFIGMFIPNTYEFYWTATPEEFTAKMKKEYDRFWNEERTKKLAHTGLSAKEVSTLASIIDEETTKTDEMATIAGAYINRLRQGMRLQADPTVKFAVGDFTIKRIMHKHLTTNSPYNTYRNTGLPPAPIRMPSVAALDAVLNYKEHKYIYFCARADFSGYHTFAETYPEHQRNARQYAAALDKAGIK